MVVTNVVVDKVIFSFLVRYLEAKGFLPFAWFIAVLF